MQLNVTVIDWLQPIISHSYQWQKSTKYIFIWKLINIINMLFFFFRLKVEKPALVAVDILTSPFKVIRSETMVFFCSKYKIVFEYRMSGSIGINFIFIFTWNLFFVFFIPKCNFNQHIVNAFCKKSKINSKLFAIYLTRNHDAKFSNIAIFKLSQR